MAQGKKIEKTVIFKDTPINYGELAGFQSILVLFNVEIFFYDIPVCKSMLWANICVYR